MDRSVSLLFLAAPVGGAIHGAVVTAVNLDTGERAVAQVASGGVRGPLGYYASFSSTDHVGLGWRNE